MHQAGMMHIFIVVLDLLGHFLLFSLKGHFLPF